MDDRISWDLFVGEEELLAASAESHEHLIELVDAYSSGTDSRISCSASSGPHVFRIKTAWIELSLPRCTQARHHCLIMMSRTTTGPGVVWTP